MMKMANEIQIENLINNIDNIQEEGALSFKIKWLRMRCLLETKAIVNDGVVSFDNADKILSDFLSVYLGGNEGIKSDDEIIKRLTSGDKYDSKEFEQKFYEVLSGIDEEEKISESWKENAQVFINYLKQYRKMGTTDNNISNQLINYAKTINNDPLRYIYELIQNADDCEYDGNNPNNPIEVKINIKEDSLEVSYPEDGMTYSDIIAITTIGQSNKRKRKKKRIIGEKGRGFKTIFSVCDFAEIHSGPYHFELSQKSFAPKWIDLQHGEKETGTKMVLHFKKNNTDGEKGFSAGQALFDKIKERYGFIQCNKQNILKNCPIIFTNKIEGLVIEYGNEQLCMKKTKKISPEDGKWKKGTLTIDYSIIIKENQTKLSDLKCYWYEKEVVFSYDEYVSHYKEIFKDPNEFEKEDAEVKTYPIVLIAPKCENGENKNDIKEWKGNMFTYLPTFTNINAPISIQAPFELNEDRSCMWINGLKGDEHAESDFEEDYNLKNELYTTKWNRRLFSELFVDQQDNPSLLKYAYNQIVVELKDKESTLIYDYIPAFEKKHTFFLSQEKNYNGCIEKLNLLDNEIIFENFKSLKFLKCLFNKSIFCCNDAPVFFDDVIDGILLSFNNEKEYNDIYDCLSSSENNLNGSVGEKIIPIIKSIKDYKNILALGVKKAELSDKVGFTNILLKHSYDNTVKELVKENGSAYFPEKGSRKELKAIKIGASFFAPGEAELWILLSKQDCCDDNIYKNGNSLKIVPNNSGVKDDNNNDIMIDSIYKNDFKNCVMDKNWKNVWKYIYSKEGAEESIKCSFGLYKELMCFFGNTRDWYAYSQECLETKSKKCTENNTEKCIIPAEHLIKIWEKQYKEYRKVKDGE